MNATNATGGGGFSWSRLLNGVTQLGQTTASVVGAFKVGAAEKQNAANSDEIERLLAAQEVARQEAAAKAKTNWPLIAGIGVAVLGLLVWAFKSR